MKKIMVCMLMLCMIVLSSCSSSTPQSMYLIGTEWNVNGLSFTVVDVTFRDNYQNELGDIIAPDSDCEFIIVECSISIPENFKLETCSVKQSDIYADSYPLFTDPIFLNDTTAPNGGNCILLFSIPIDKSSRNLSSYTMNIGIDVDGKIYSEEFSFSQSQ